MRSDFPILLVEDDIVDVKTVQRAFRDHAIVNPLVVCRHGEDALSWLRRDSPYDNQSSAPQPGLIILDLNMPVMSGLEFLETVKQDSALRSIPVIVLTSSAEEADLKRCYTHGVAGYIVKPVDYRQFLGAVQVIDNYWSLSMVPCG